MVNIKLKDGSFKEYEKGITIYDIALSISEGLARNVFAGEVNGKLVDVRFEVNEDCSLNLLTFNDEKGKEAFRHTSSHILAQAVKRLFPESKLAIGPAIHDGFYYDFDIDKSFLAEDIIKIEKEMKKIVKENLKIEKFTLSKEEAIKLMEDKDEPYKVELIKDLKDGEEISFYKQGEFVDLCSGPHLLSTKQVKSIKLTSTKGSSGAYWRGNEKNKMLKRIYGTSFLKNSELNKFLEAKEEAKKRDHNKLGRELKLFTTSSNIGQGLPILMPKGAKIMQTLQRFVEDTEEKRGYLLTKTPLMAKSDLYKESGHWDHYKENMFIVSDDENDFALRPMTCPFQFTVYNSESHSYRDLPKRYSETSTLFRNESSGEMHGLIRVRQFTISEGHIVCTKEQLKDEFKGVIDLIDYFMCTLNIKDDVKYMLSKWNPNNKEKYIGTQKQWDDTQNQLRDILDELKMDYIEVEGEAAFYGPKLDILFKNVHGKEDTIITVQIDFALAEKFNMTYVNNKGEKEYPVIIHRTSIGCYERTLAMLIEKYAGVFPTWLAPVQVILLPISDKFIEYTNNVANKLRENNIKVEIDSRVETLGYKIREARLQRIPYICVIGENECNNETLSIKNRNQDEKVCSIDTFISDINIEIKDKI